jgi:hypothetical protein
MKRIHAFATAAATLGLFCALYACTGDDTNPITTTDAGVHEGGTLNPNDSGNPQPSNDANPGTDAPTANCYAGTINAQSTYDQIINACTPALGIDKTDDLSPMNLPDGGLQPVP